MKLTCRKCNESRKEYENDNEPWWCMHVDFCYNKNQSRHNVVQNIDSPRMSCEKIWSGEVTNGKQFKTHQENKNITKQKFCYCNYVELHYCRKGEREICNEHNV